jgi:hypothetical protein
MRLFPSLQKLANASKGREQVINWKELDGTGDRLEISPRKQLIYLAQPTDWTVS